MIGAPNTEQGSMAASGFEGPDLCSEDHWACEPTEGHGMVERQPALLADTTGPGERLLWSESDIAIGHDKDAVPGLDDDMAYDSLHEPGNHGIGAQGSIRASGGQELMLEEQSTSSIGMQDSGPALPLIFPPLDVSEVVESASPPDHLGEVGEGSCPAKEATKTRARTLLKTRSSSRTGAAAAGSVDLFSKRMATSESSSRGKRERKGGASPQTESTTEDPGSLSHGTQNSGESCRKKNRQAQAREARIDWRVRQGLLETRCKDANIEDSPHLVRGLKHHISESLSHGCLPLVRMRIQNGSTNVQFPTLSTLSKEVRNTSEIRQNTPKCETKSTYSALYP
jgi:hypothetical protein